MGADIKGVDERRWEGEVADENERNLFRVLELSKRSPRILHGINRRFDEDISVFYFFFIFSMVVGQNDCW